MSDSAKMRDAINLLKIIYEEVDSKGAVGLNRKCLPILKKAISALSEQSLGNEKQATSDWISVEERLPEDDACYLVCVSGRHENITFDRALEVAEYVSGCGWFLDGWPEWVKPGITHWMPMPEPPKEGQHEV